MGTLINGNGNPHVYAHQDSDLIAGIVGSNTSIMPVGDKFEANQEDANTIAVSNGVIITKEGRRIQLDVGTIDEFIIPTGAQDVQSFYIIGYHLYEDGNSDQLCETFVRKMESASDTIPESTFRSGATEVYVSLYRVTQDSLNITDIDLLLPYADSIEEVKRNGGNKNLAAIEDGSTASQPYVKGEFVIVGGQFCEVTASISTNDAFVAYPLPNYNIKPGTVGDQITAVNQNLTNINVRYNNGKIQYYDGTDWVDWASVSPSTLTNLITAPLTQNVTQEGVVSGTAEYGTSNPANVYKAFGLSNSNTYIYQAGSSPSLMFTFNEVTYVDVVQFDCTGNGNVACSYQLQASYDGTTWFNCGSAVGTSSATWLPSQREIHAPIKAFRFVTSSGGAVGIGYRRVMAYKYN